MPAMVWPGGYSLLLIKKQGRVLCGITARILPSRIVFIKKGRTDGEQKRMAACPLDCRLCDLSQGAGNKGTTDHGGGFACSGLE